MEREIADLGFRIANLKIVRLLTVPASGERLHEEIEIQGRNVSCIMGRSTKPVIPEVVKRLSGIQKNSSLLDSGSRPPQEDSSGIMIVSSYKYFRQSAKEKFNHGRATTEY